MEGSIGNLGKGGEPGAPPPEMHMPEHGGADVGNIDRRQRGDPADDLHADGSFGDNDSAGDRIGSSSGDLSIGGGDDPESAKTTHIVPETRGRLTDTLRPVEASDLEAINYLLLKEQKARKAAELRADTAEQQLSDAIESSRVDELTKLENTAGIQHAFEQQLSDHQRLEKEHGISIPVSAIFVDLDFFKFINDTHGHSIGDEVLINTAALLAGSVTRKADVAARMGGDELMLLLPGTDAAGAAAIAKKVQDAIIAYGLENGYKVGASVGAATFSCSNDPDLNFGALKEQADKAMYVDKAGKATRLKLSPEEIAARAEVRKS